MCQVYGRAKSLAPLLHTNPDHAEEWKLFTKEAFHEARKCLESKFSQEIEKLGPPTDGVVRVPGYATVNFTEIAVSSSKGDESMGQMEVQWITQLCDEESQITPFELTRDFRRVANLKTDEDFDAALAKLETLTIEERSESTMQDQLMTEPEEEDIFMFINDSP